MTWTYNENDELLDSDSESYEYDANGNMTKKTIDTDVVNYIFNVEDRLIKVEDGTGTVIAEYYYDPFGRRLWKEVGGTRTYFLFADEGLVGEYYSSGVELKAYGYKPNATFTTDPLFMKEGDNYYFYQNDHLGTPQKVTSVNGAVAWSAKYTSFGKVQVEVETIENNLRFPGQYYDQETGLHYNYYRYYDPIIGRYMRPDPIGLAGGINLYGYVDNNPIVEIDPEGKGVKDIFLCLYYSRKMQKYLEKCAEELDRLREKYRDCPFQADFEFMNKYNSKWISEALIKCALQKCPDKKLAYKWLKNCVKGAWTPPVIPRR